MTDSPDIKRQERLNKIENMQPIGNNLTLTAAEKLKLEIFSSCIEDLEDSINNNANSSQSLATKVYWLNVILVFATVIGTIVGILNLINCPN